MAGGNNDPFEEFEFRPINEGLGFHRKQKAAQAQQQQIQNSTPILKTKILDLTENFERKPEVSFKSPLPRVENKMRSQIQVPMIEDDSISKAQNSVNEILKSLNQKRQLDFAEDRVKQKTEFKKSKPQMFAAVLDGMLVISAFLLSLIVMLSITKVDLFLNLSHPQTSQMIYVATAGLFFAIHFIYMVVNRAFAGYTPGEWAFDQICGNKNQNEEISYIPKVIFRTLVVSVTGFVVIPFLSYLFNKDLAGELAGVTLFQKPNV